MHKLRNNILIMFIILLNIITISCSQNIKLTNNKFDPIEVLNRKIFLFNKVSDKVIFKPAIDTYNSNIPYFVKDIVNNFCSNIAIIPTITNNILQGNIKEAQNNTFVFFINSSVGNLGMFDISLKLGMSAGKELSFSNSLVYYKYNTPFYFVLPILGPSTMTNLVTFIPDYFFNPQSILNKKYKKLLFWSVLFNKKVQLLEKEFLMNMSSSSIDEYAFVRDAYLQYNKFNIYY